MLSISGKLLASFQCFFALNKNIYITTVLVFQASLCANQVKAYSFHNYVPTIGMRFHLNNATRHLLIFSKSNSNCFILTLTYDVKSFLLVYHFNTLNNSIVFLFVLFMFVLNIVNNIELCVPTTFVYLFTDYLFSCIYFLVFLYLSIFTAFFILLTVIVWCCLYIAYISLIYFYLNILPVSHFM